MAKYRINIALWQVPTMVVNTHNDAKDGYQRALANTVADKSLDERLALLRKRVEKADKFLRPRNSLATMGPWGHCLRPDHRNDVRWLWGSSKEKRRVVQARRRWFDYWRREIIHCGGRPVHHADCW